MSAVQVDLLIEQGADWPGISVPMLDKLNAPFTVTGCTAHGQIKGHRNDTVPIFTWSSTPAAGEGLITLVGTSVAWRLLAAESELWTFTRAEYQIELHNPAGPVGDQTIRVAQGAVLLDLELDRTP